MPKLSDIEKLKDIVDSLGDEKGIRSKRGERIEEVSPPEPPISSADIDTLLGSGPEGEGTDALRPPEEIISAALEEPGESEDDRIDDISQALEETGVVAPASEETMGLDVLPESFGEEPTSFTEEPVDEAEGLSPAGAASGEPNIENVTFPDFDTGEGAEAPEAAAAAPFEEPALPADAGETSTPVKADLGSAEPTFNLSDFQIAEPPAGVASDADRLFEEPQMVQPPEEGAGESAAEAMEGLDEIPSDDSTAAAFDGADEERGVFDLPHFRGSPGAEPALDLNEPAAESDREPEAGAGVFGGADEKLFDLPEEEGTPSAGTVETGEETGEGDAFAGFEMPDLSEIGTGAIEGTESPGAGETGGLDTFDIGEFALPGAVEEPVPAAGKIDFGAALEEPGLHAEELPDAEEDMRFSERDFENIKASLALLPLNLKIIVEELVANASFRGAPLKRLLGALSAGESPKAIAGIVSSITGQKIVLPKSFEKRSGVAFEREKGSIAYFLRTKGLPAAVILAAAVVAFAFLAYGAYLFIFRPLAAAAIYDEGYRAIGENLYEKARQKFDEASRIWDAKDQYYRFAEAFAASAAGNYRYADQMYRALLKRYPGDIKGMIDYARLETLQRNFTHAETLLVDGVLKREPHHFDALAACAENYLVWAEEDPAKLKDADYYYTTIADRYRDRTAAHLKRLEYLIRSERIARAAGNTDFDNTNKVLAYTAFLKKRGWDIIDPAVYTMTAEYLIDKNETDAVPELLDHARATDPGYAPAWYETARSFRLAGEHEKERKALERAVELFRNPDPSSARGFALAAERRHSIERTAKLVLSLNRLGEYHSAQGQPERAEDLLLDAQRLYEQSAADLKTTRFAAGGAFGRLYYNLGNIALGAGNDGRALDLYAKAEENGYTSPDQTYKKGFIFYRRGEYASAVVAFHRADLELPENDAILFALATTEYRRFQFRIAEGIYLSLINVLGRKKDALPRIDVAANPEHRDLITNFYITYNNLGCTYFKISGGRDNAHMTEAVNYLRKASELYDVMSRDPDTLARLEETTIAVRRGKKEIVKGKGESARYLKAPAPLYNLDIIFHDKAGSVVLGEKIDVLIYDLLPRNLEKPEFLSSRLTAP